MHTYRIELTGEPQDEDRTFLHEQIKAFNNTASHHHLAARQPGAILPLCLFLRGPEGELLGGLSADTYWGWLDIDDLWLHPSLRGQGVGRQLLALAEDEARQRDCRRAQVKTFSFQARAFYEKQGYRVVGELRDYPPGASLYWLRKDL